MSEKDIIDLYAKELKLASLRENVSLLFSARFCLKKIICLKMKYIQFPKRAFWDTPFRCEG